MQFFKKKKKLWQTISGVPKGMEEKRDIVWVTVWKGNFLDWALDQRMKGSRHTDLSLEVCLASGDCLANACVKTLIVLLCVYHGGHPLRGL